MLRRLSVENYALIDKLEMELDPHLNIITGETGAGKSILLGALGLLLGAKNDGQAMKDATRNCTVEGTFDLAGSSLEAFFAENDALAIGVIHELQRRGVRVPQDMQVIGFDNVPDAEYCMPGLTTIDPHVDDYARHAVDMLIARIEGSADPFRTYVTSYDLVRRASTC